MKQPNTSNKTKSDTRKSGLNSIANAFGGLVRKAVSGKRKRAQQLKDAGKKR